jgi:hypothetical protein
MELIKNFIANQRLMRYLKKNCDFEMAKSLIIKKFSNAVIPNELARLFDAFVRKPGPGTALDLIHFDSDIFAYFEFCQKQLSKEDKNGK